jgi:hypothetical protein
LFVVQQAGQLRIRLEKMVYPYRCINQNHGSKPTTRRSLRIGSNPTHSGQTAPCFSPDERRQGFTNQLGIFLRAAKLSRFIEKIIVNDDCRAHAGTRVLADNTAI